MRYGWSAASSAALSFHSILLASLVILHASPSSSANFRCSSQPRSCETLLGFPTPPNSTYMSLKNLFAIKSIRRLFAVNNLPATTDPNRPVPSDSIIRVPFPCSCSNGTGSSAGRPIYTLRKGESLDLVARSVFGGFVDFQQLAAANGIKDPNKVNAGKKLRVPLPCSCDRVDGTDVVHYAHKVAGGSSLEGIAADFGTKVETLTALNGIADPKSLQAEQVLDVPLRVCSSSVRNDSLDSPLLVPNNSYVLTAGNCVQCSCSSSTWQLQCSTVEGLKTNKWPVCPPATCPNTSLALGNSFVSGLSQCGATVCAYAGYTNAAILTAVTTSVCPAQDNGTSPSLMPQGSSASSLGGLIRMKLLLAFNIVYLALIY